MGRLCVVWSDESEGEILSVSASAVLDEQTLAGAVLRRAGARHSTELTVTLDMSN